MVIHIRIHITTIEHTTYYGEYVYIHNHSTVRIHL